MIRWVARIRIWVLLLLFAAAAPMAAAQQQPPPEKVEQLIQILSDPAVKSWLEQQARVPQPAAATEQASGDASSLLSRALASLKAHVGELIAAYVRLPAQFERA